MQVGHTHIHTKAACSIFMFYILNCLLNVRFLPTFLSTKQRERKKTIEANHKIHIMNKNWRYSDIIFARKLCH